MSQRLLPLRGSIETAMYPSMWARPNRPKRVWDREERAQNRSTRARWAEENQAADAADQAADEEEQARGRSRLQDPVSYSTLQDNFNKSQADLAVVRQEFEIYQEARDADPATRVVMPYPGIQIDWNENDTTLLE